MPACTSVVSCRGAELGLAPLRVPARPLSSTGSAAGFLRILSPHDGCDVVIVCRRAGALNRQGGEIRTGTADEVRFFCYRAVLARSCRRFSGSDDVDVAEAPAAKRRRIMEVFDADDDIVFEVLRFIYCGTLHFPRRFLGRLGQLLHIADQLGLEAPPAATAVRTALAAGGASLPLTPRPRRRAPAAAGEAEMLGADAAEVPQVEAVDAKGLLAEPGLQRFLFSAPEKELVAMLRGQALAYTPDAEPLPQERRAELLELLARLRPEDFSVQALCAKGSNFQDLVDMHPALVHVKVYSMAGTAIFDQTLDASTPVKHIKTHLYSSTPWANDAKLSLACQEAVLEDGTTLEDLGARGFGCSLDLAMIRTALQIRFCSCNVPAQRCIMTKDGPYQGRAYLRCSGYRGTRDGSILSSPQCPFFEWTD